MRLPWRRLTRDGGSESLLGVVLIGTVVVIAVLVGLAMLVDRL